MAVMKMSPLARKFNDRLHIPQELAGNSAECSMPEDMAASTNTEDLISTNTEGLISTKRAFNMQAA